MKKNKSIGKNAVLNIIKNCCNILIPLITYPYVTRVLGSANFGKFSFADSVISVALILASLGIPTYAIREGARVRDDKNKIFTFCTEVFSINLIAMLATYAILFILVANVGKMKNNAQLILILSINIIAFTLGRDWINSIYEDYFFITVRYLIFHLLSTALIFILVHERMDYIKYTWIVLLGNAGGYFANILYSKKYVKYGVTLDRRLQKHIKPIMYLFGVTVAVQIYVRSDIIILGFFRPDSEVGVYTLSARVYTIIKTLLNAVTTVSIPRVSHYLGSGQFDQLETLLNKLRNALIVLVFPCIVGLFFQAGNVLRIIGGDEFVNGDYSLKILCIAMVFAVFGCFYAQGILVPSRKEKVFFTATCISAAVNIGLNLILIPFLGINGAAVTTAIAEGIVFTMCLLKSRDVFKPKKRNYKQYISVAVGCTAIALICIVVRTFVSVYYVELMISVAVSVVLYALILVLMKNEFAMDVISNVKKRIG